MLRNRYLCTNVYHGSRQQQLYTEVAQVYTERVRIANRCRSSTQPGGDTKSKTMLQIRTKRLLYPDDDVRREGGLYISWVAGHRLKPHPHTDYILPWIYYTQAQEATIDEVLFFSDSTKNSNKSTPILCMSHSRMCRISCHQDRRAGECESNASCVMRHLWCVLCCAGDIMGIS